MHPNKFLYLNPEKYTSGWTDRSVSILATAVVLTSLASTAASAHESVGPSGSRLISLRAKGADPASSKKAKSKEEEKSDSADKPAPKGKINAWKLSQASKFVGPVDCLIADKAVKIRAEKMGITWLFRAPSWEAFMYNTETKNYCSFPYEVWKNKVFFMPSGKAGQTRAKMQQFSVAPSGKKETIAGQSAHELLIKDEAGQPAGAIWMASKIAAPKQFSEVIGSMVNVPLKSGGAPLKVMMRQKQGNIAPMLETTAVAKNSVDSTQFEPLTGYQKVKDEMALLFAEGESPGAGSILDDEPTSPKSRKKRIRSELDKAKYEF